MITKQKSPVIVIIRTMLSLLVRHKHGVRRGRQEGALAPWPTFFEENSMFSSMFLPSPGKKSAYAHGHKLSFGAQSDHIKRPVLYKNTVTFNKVISSTHALTHTHTSIY